MPFATFSRIVSSKLPASNVQFSAPDTLENSPQYLTASPSKKFSRSPPSPRGFMKRSTHPKPKKETGLKRNKDRDSDAWTFFDPFNVLTSFRARSKSKGAEAEAVPQSCSKTLSGHKYSSYSGYDDEDYGEPQAEAEEIRRPSGLGERANITKTRVDILRKKTGEKLAPSQSEGIATMESVT